MEGKHGPISPGTVRLCLNSKIVASTSSSSETQSSHERSALLFLFDG